MTNNSIGVKDSFLDKVVALIPQQSVRFIVYSLLPIVILYASRLVSEDI